MFVTSSSPDEFRRIAVHVGETENPSHTLLQQEPPDNLQDGLVAVFVCSSNTVSRQFVKKT